ncbi:hypothetical protein SELMODRAFT_427866 [Selaginella moellendorffii]|uniref:Secreted protein n=1 Tax=Selaginella moellendorffii TaxID=88036 RepID=D8T0Y6_SELML|nr:hypothetical protein SELMODRAFT_427866 [Selaginella moellendorffii]
MSVAKLVVVFFCLTSVLWQHAGSHSLNLENVVYSGSMAHIEQQNETHATPSSRILKNATSSDSSYLTRIRLDCRSPVYSQHQTSARANKIKRERARRTQSALTQPSDPSRIERHDKHSDRELPAQQMCRRIPVTLICGESIDDPAKVVHVDRKDEAVHDGCQAAK